MLKLQLMAIGPTKLGHKMSLRKTEQIGFIHVLGGIFLPLLLVGKAK